MTGGNVMAYLLFALLPGVMCGIVYSDSRRYHDAAPALGFMAGLLWPLTVLALLGHVAWSAGRALAHSFAALWGETLGAVLARRRARVKLPRAQTSMRSRP